MKSIFPLFLLFIQYALASDSDEKSIFPISTARQHGSTLVTFSVTAIANSVAQVTWCEINDVVDHPFSRRYTEVWRLRHNETETIYELNSAKEHDKLWQFLYNIAYPPRPNNESSLEEDVRF